MRSGSPVAFPYWHRRPVSGALRQLVHKYYHRYLQSPSAFCQHFQTYESVSLVRWCLYSWYAPAARYRWSFAWLFSWGRRFQTSFWSACPDLRGRSPSAPAGLLCAVALSGRAQTSPLSDFYQNLGCAIQYHPCGGSHTQLSQFAWFALAFALWQNTAGSAPLFCMHRHKIQSF